MTVGRILRRVLWLLVAGSIAVAVLRGFSADPNALFPWGKEKSGEAETFVSDLNTKLEDALSNLPKPTSILEPDQASPSPASEPAADESKKN